LRKTLVWSIETFILLAAAVIAEGLVDLEFWGNAEDLVEMDAHALFFPHGVGHLLGWMSIWRIWVI